MSSANFLEKLLHGVAVEWRALGEVTLPTSNIRWRDAERAYRYIDLTSVHIETKAIGETTEIQASNAPSRAQKLVEKDDLIFATTRPTQQRYCLISEENSGEVASTGYCVLRAKQEVVLPKWILHWIASREFKTYVEENQSGSAYPAISDAKVKDFKIPIPCPENPKKSLEIQAEIVRILDAFTSLTAELTAELTARKKQYNHYRDQLLRFEDGLVEWKSLGEVVSTIKTGKLNANAMVEDGAYPFFTCDAKPFKIDTYAFDTEAIIVSGNGSQVGHINYYKGRFNAYQRTYILADCSDVITMEFLLAYLKAYLRAYIMQHSKKGSVPYITMPMLEGFSVPTPPLEDQIRIASILEKFDALTNSITEGLPGEIELRQKQYAYYRDLLLSFPKPEAVAA